MNNAAQAANSTLIKTVKKSFIISFVAAALLSAIILAGCAKPRELRIGVSQCSNDDWREQLNEEIKRETMLHNELKVEILSADDNTDKQIADIRHFINDKVDALIVSPIEANALTPVIAEAYESGIPVIVFDREVNGNAFTAYLGADNRLIGVHAAEWLKSRKPQGGKIIEIKGLPESTPAAHRHEGFVECLKDKPEFEITATADGDWTAESALHIADSLLKAHPETEIIFAQNDRMAIAARDAADNLGRKGLTIIGVDAVPQTGIKAVAEGKIDATFLYPTGGRQLVSIAMAILNGKPFDRHTLLSSANPVDSTNAGILLLQANSLESETAKIKYLKGQVDDYSSRHSSQTLLLYAIIAILVLLSGFVFMLLHAFWQRKRHQALLSEQNGKLKEQRDELISLNKQLQEATQAKLAFFTNVSHDLRTPLTLISDPIDQIKDAGNLNPSQHTLMQLASKNVKILMRLINQILDFNKYESGKLELQLSEVNLLEWTMEMFDRFRPLALKKHITLKADLNAVPEGFTLALDSNKMERVFYNLLSNAFKFTPENGSITLTMKQAGDSIVATVADTGRGMNLEEMKRVFERFYQTDRMQPGGSGIGLAVAKSFVNLHGGDISVESEKGKGSVFTITIPLRHVDAPAPTSAAIESTLITNELEDVVTEEHESEFDNDRPTVLVIDDTADIRTLLKTQLAADYNVMLAADGPQGIKMASKYIPDLIICDVMMPGMDGMECCSRIKSETSTSHIPVLMLTACSLDQQRVEGYENGADGYLSKPFNTRVLLARCQSLISNRKRIKESFADNTRPLAAATQNTSQPGTQKERKAGSSDIDNEFYDRFLSIVEKEISNPELSVEEIGSRLGLSRVQFYRKIKALTNYSPNELVRNIRLKKAKSLLTSTESTVGEVAYSVGFSSPSYFSKCFREYFGELPAEVQKRTSKISDK